MPMGHTATAQAGSGGLTATEHRLANGLRVVLSEDHLTPVAAVCLWYDVGSRHEVKGRTGLAHLFEHLMFQGSAQVKGNGHFELVQGAGGSLNGTTSFERTNYFETMPAHQLELALWLEADRMGSPAGRARRRVDGEPAGRRQERAPPALRQRPLRHGLREADRPRLPARATPTTTPRSARWPTWTRPPWRTPARSSAPTTRRTTPCSPWSATSTRSRPWPGSRSTSAPSQGHDGKPAPRDGTLPETIGEQLREVVEEEVPARALMAAYRLPHGRHARVRRGRPGPHRPRRRRVLPPLQPARAARPYGRGGRVRPAAARRGALPGLAGREDVRRRRGAGHRGRHRRGARPVRRGGPHRRGDGARPGPVGARVAGPARHGRGPRRRTVPVRRAVRRPAARPDRRAARAGGDGGGGPGGRQGPPASRQPRGARLRAGRRRDRRRGSRRGRRRHRSAATTRTRRRPSDRARHAWTSTPSPRPARPGRGPSRPPSAARWTTV